MKNGLILGKNLPDISFGSSVDQMSNDLLVFLPAGNLDQGVRVEDASFPVDVEPLFKVVDDLLQVPLLDAFPDVCLAC